MIEKVDAKQILKDYLNTIKIRKQVTTDYIDNVSKNFPNPPQQFIIKLKTRKQVYNEIIKDILELLAENFEEEE
jgi:hypothetical protein